MTILDEVEDVDAVEDEDEGDTFAISKTIRFYSNAIAMPYLKGRWCGNLN